MIASRKEKVLDASIDYCIKDAYPTGNSGFRAGAEWMEEDIKKELSEYAQSTNNSRVIEIISAALYHVMEKEK